MNCHSCNISGHLLHPGREADYCDQFVCLSVCPQAYLWKSWTVSSRNFVCRYLVVMARSSFGSVAIRYVRLVLWMTSRLAIVGRVAMRGNTGAE